MMIQAFFLDTEEYKNQPLKNRIIYDIIAYEANYRFEDGVIEILVKRNPDREKWDSNTKCTINAHKANRDTAWECKYHLTELYNSEWEELTEEELTIIKNIATEYANIALDKFGWKKGK